MTINPTVARMNAEALTKAVGKSELHNKPLGREGGFKEMLDNMQSASDFARSVGMESKSIDPAGTMKALPGHEVSFTPAEQVARTESPEVSRKVVDMLSDVNKGQIQMDSMINQMLYSDKKFNNQELLAIQAHVYHYAQMAELTVKIAEHGISSTKQVLNTQVQ